MLNVQDSRHGYAPHTRPAGQIVDAEVRHQIVPWAIVIDNSTATTSGYRITNDQEIDKIEEIRLVAVSGDAPGTRRLLITNQSNEPMLRDMRVHQPNTPNIHSELVITPGINLGEGLVVAHSRDARLLIPKVINVIQKNIDGTPFVGDHQIRLYFNVKVHRFQ